MIPGHYVCSLPPSQPTNFGEKLSPKLSLESTFRLWLMHCRRCLAWCHEAILPNHFIHTHLHPCYLFLRMRFYSFHQTITHDISECNFNC
mmetsp:Transcript_33556/g.50043  ORF Transcript_33556/g.50043 Transcript_33556/m.50043 type:complete len:90 (-) Transcript_33556:191-460(-)